MTPQERALIRLLADEVERLSISLFHITDGGRTRYTPPTIVGKAFQLLNDTCDQALQEGADG